MTILDAFKRLGIGKTWVFGWTGYDAEEETCKEPDCGVKRKWHKQIAHPFKEAE